MFDKNAVMLYYQGFSGFGLFVRPAAVIVFGLFVRGRWTYPEGKKGRGLFRRVNPFRRKNTKKECCHGKGK